MVVANFIAVGLLLAILQTTVCMPRTVWLLAPDLYFLLVAYLAFRLDVLRSLIILFPLACILDVLSGTVLGAYPLLCYGGYALIRTVASKLPITESLYKIPLIGLGYLAISWAVSLLLGLLEPEQLVAWSWWKMVVRALLVSALVYPLFFGFDLVQKYSHRNYLPWNRLRLRTDNRRRRRA